jgi:hypothetical protein
MHMDFTEAIAIASELAPSMVDALMVIAPGRQAGRNDNLTRATVESEHDMAITTLAGARRL